MNVAVKCLLFAGLLLLSANAASAAPLAPQDTPPIAAPTVHIDVQQMLPPGTENFDAEKSTGAYLAQIPKDKRARSDAYTEGNHILSFVDLIYGLVIAALLLWTRASAKIRDWTERRSKRKFGQAALYIAAYLIITTLVALPLTVYEGFFREHHYALSNQSFGAWAGEYGIGFALNLILLTVLLSVIYAVARKVQKSWWLWGAGISVIFLAIMLMISPVFIAPIFNHYTPLPDSGMKAAILAQAQANGVPAKNVYVYDASKQSNRISANVSGFLGTTRIALNDNLLDRSTPNEVLAVTTHEIGHYVMNHIAVMLTWYGLIVVLVFGLTDLGFRGLTKVFGERWKVRGIADTAGLPLIVALFSVLMFLAAPLTNTISRSMETQADLFGLNAARQPDAFAKAILKLSPYRKLDPSPLEEFWFYNHPSGKNRILTAMRWKAAHLYDQDILEGPVSPQ